VTEVGRRIAGQFGSRFLRSYARGKLRSDPVYRAVLDHLRESPAPVYDIGCGVGLLEFYLREYGFAGPITGIDHDARKVAAASEIGARYPALDFRAGDARDPIPGGNNIVLIDVLHYFSDDDQRLILDNAATALPAGGVVIIRSAIRDGSVRYRLTVAQERFARGIRWLRAERLNFPSRDAIVQSFRTFEREIVPMWGRTPFNNYLFVFRRSIGGMTNR
jgi:SAM-dependent methyltransferase